MDRLTKPDVQAIDIVFIRGQKCSQIFKLTNLMHTMPVAVSLTTSNTSLFSFNHSLSLIPPLSTASFSLLLNKPCDQPPLSTPPDAVLVRSSMLPTGKATQVDLRRIFSKPGPRVFKDATLPISLVGPHVAEFCLSPFCKSLEIDFQFSKAISRCNESEIDSLLRTAVRNGRPRFVTALIEAGADPNAREGSDGESLMYVAVKSGDNESVTFLIESGFAIDSRNDRSLHVAASMNRVDMMEILCLNYVDLDLNSRDHLGQTALHLAAIHGQLEAIQFLVSVGADTDVTDQEGYNPLHHVAEQGHLDAVEYLLNHSTFTKYAVTKQGKTPFALAFERGNSDLYDALHFGDSLHRAARIDDIHTLKSCLAQGAKVNGVDQNGWTPLHRAAFKGNMESVKILVAHGARVDLVDGSGYTPLLRAVEAGHVEVGMYLLSHGAKAGLKGLKGFGDRDGECLKNYPSVVNSNLLE